MADHLLFQKSLLAGIKDVNLTPGQPKILDYLLSHDGAVQKEIAEACHIEPATITSVLIAYVFFNKDKQKYTGSC